MIKVDIYSLWTQLLHLHALELRLCTNDLSSKLVHEMHEMSNHNSMKMKEFVPREEARTVHSEDTIPFTTHHPDILCAGVDTDPPSHPPPTNRAFPTNLFLPSKLPSKGPFQIYFRKKLTLLFLQMKNYHKNYQQYSRFGTIIWALGAQLSMRMSHLSLHLY